MKNELHLPWGCEITPFFNSLHPVFPVTNKHTFIRYDQLPRCPRCSAFPSKQLTFTEKGKLQCPLCFHEYPIPQKYLSPSDRLRSAELSQEVYDVVNFTDGLSLLINVIRLERILLLLFSTFCFTNISTNFKLGSEISFLY